MHNMANITNEQRNGLVKIIEDNGRSKEFYEKYGKSRSEAVRKEAQEILEKLNDANETVSKLSEKHREAVRSLEAQQTKEINDVSAKERQLTKKLAALGFERDYIYGDNGKEWILREDTSITAHEYEMFKKRALAGVWGAETLEVANEAIRKYLDLEK